MQRYSSVKKARIGLYTTGLKEYWNQFTGLKHRLISYGQFIEKKMQILGEVYNFGIVDDVEKGRKAGEWFNANNIDIIFCHSGTYFTSNTVIPIHQICKKPVIVLSLQPTTAMNYESTTTGEWLAHCVSCPIPEVANAFNRADIDCTIINGLLGLDTTPDISLCNEVTNDREESKRAWREIEEWIKAATVLRTLQFSTFGFLGNTYNGMLDLYSDMTLLQARMGINISVIEMCDLYHFFTRVQEKEVESMLEEIYSFFTISGNSSSDPIAKTPSKEQLHWSAKVAVAQRKMIEALRLDALAYYYHGTDANVYEELQGGFIVGHSLLTASGVPCAGEGDLKTAVAMKICDILDCGGSYSEIVAADYERNTILLGHDGPFHIKIAADTPVLRSMELYHGKKGKGVSVEAQILQGPVSILGLTQTKENLQFIVSEGHSVDAPLLRIGNTTTHVNFSERPDLFMDRWFIEVPTHHCALSVGRNASMFQKIGKLLNIQTSVLHREEGNEK